MPSKILNRLETIEEGRRCLESVKDVQQTQLSKNILIVEDDPMDVELLLHRLSKFPCASDIAPGAERAIELLKLKKYDLMFLDLRLLASSGLDVLKFCKEQMVALPTIVLTGSFLMGGNETERAWELGALFVAKKPMNEDQLRLLFQTP